jgi:hypothetical protein
VPLPPSPLPDKLYAVIDGTGVPMTSRETAGREGKGDDGRARTREVKLAIFFTQDRLDKDGCPVRDRDSASVIATFVPAAVFAGLVKAEGIRRGADHVRQLGAVPVTAEAAVLNFTSTTQLDPSDYTNPEQLLNNVGTAFLTTLPGWLSGWFCCSPCICFPRRTNRRHNGDWGVPARSTEAGRDAASNGEPCDGRSGSDDRERGYSDRPCGVEPHDVR